MGIITMEDNWEIGMANKLKGMDSIPLKIISSFGVFTIMAPAIGIFYLALIIGLISVSIIAMILEFAGEIFQS